MLNDVVLNVVAWRGVWLAWRGSYDGAPLTPAGVAQWPFSRRNINGNMAVAIVADA
jgi:hypothetical protein